MSVHVEPAYNEVTINFSAFSSCDSKCGVACQVTRKMKILVKMKGSRSKVPNFIFQTLNIEPWPLDIKSTELIKHLYQVLTNHLRVSSFNVVSLHEVNQLPIFEQCNRR